MNNNYPDSRSAPGPKGLPLIGNVLDLRGNMLDVLTNIHRDFGDLVKFRVAHLQYYSLNHPDFAKHVLISNKDNYEKDGRSSKQIRLLAGQSLLTDNGDSWYHKRRLLQNTFRLDTVKKFKDVVVSESNLLLDSWRNLNGPIDIHSAMMHLTYQVIGKSLLSEDLTHTTNQVATSMDVSLLHLYKRIFGLAFPLSIPTAGNLRFVRERKQLHHIVDKILMQRDVNVDHGSDDLLDKMIQAQQSEDLFDSTWLRDEVVTLLLAGHETTANALTWVWYLLAQHPDVEQQVYDEITQHFNGPVDDVEKLSNLSYTLKVFYEAIRLYPPIWAIERSTRETDEIGGYNIAKGSTLFISIYTLHRHPEFWQDANEFRPERFDNMRNASMAYMPFGLGQRMCMGKNFAIQEAMIVLVYLVQHCRLRLVSDKPARPEPGITLRVRDKLMMNIAWRK
ncbi:hypothetical protein MNBD_GAMMA21-2152 [hydrothermal vent metagenome]|uniref:Cytochrome P450 n=1 Tax=hydrothermal vent metagenome TaxID=652676 RepID=A0A3B1AXR1_9ZZZZ